MALIALRIGRRCDSYRSIPERVTVPCCTIVVSADCDPPPARTSRLLTVLVSSLSEIRFSPNMVHPFLKGATAKQRVTRDEGINHMACIRSVRVDLPSTTSLYDPQTHKALTLFPKRRFGQKIRHQASKGTAWASAIPHAARSSPPARRARICHPNRSARHLRDPLFRGKRPPGHRNGYCRYPTMRYNICTCAFCS